MQKKKKKIVKSSEGGKNFFTPLYVTLCVYIYEEFIYKNRYIKNHVFIMLSCIYC